MALAVITGASSGIGREFVKQLHEKGEADEFWFISRNAEKLGAVRDSLGVRAEIIAADLTSAEGIEKVRAALEEKKPHIKYLINASGFGKFGNFSLLSENDVCGMIDLNVKALVLITHMCIPYMERGGHVIEMGSGSCFVPMPDFNIYASSKAFVLHYTKALKYELIPYGISATCFCPGWVKTEFFGTAFSVKGARVPKKMKPMLLPEDVVARCIKAAKKGKVMCVTNWYTKVQHVLFKILPDCILTKIWLGMQTDNTKEG